MATLFFFLASLGLILGLYPIWVFIIIVLWRLRYVLLGLVALLTVLFVWGYHNETVKNQALAAAHPWVYHDSVKEWNDAHPEVINPAPAPSPKIVQDDLTKLLLPTVQP